MSNFYVYVHFRATDGRLFYIGKGSKRRASYQPTSETRAKLSAALRGKVRGPAPARVKAALAAAREKRKRPVVTACGLRFESTLEAARVTGVRQGNIVNNCVGRAKSAGGYQWRYADAS